MSKISLALVAVVLTAIVRIIAHRSRPKRPTIRVRPKSRRTWRGLPVSANAVQERIGYRACVARISEWVCQEFPPTEPSTEPLRNALVNLGNDGWELVSAVEDYPHFGTQFGANGLTYLFKRQIR